MFYLISAVLVSLGMVYQPYQAASYMILFAVIHALYLIREKNEKAR